MRTRPAMRAADPQDESQHGETHSGNGHPDHVDGAKARICNDRMDQRRGAKDAKDVEDVRADDVAHGDLGLPPRMAAIRDVASSGSEGFPQPRSSGRSPPPEMPNARASSVALSTSSRAPARTTNPQRSLPMLSAGDPLLDVRVSTLLVMKAVTRKTIRPVIKHAVQSGDIAVQGSMIQMVAVANNMKPRSRQSFFTGMIRGATTAEMPRISRMLAMFEPRTFPIAMAG